MADETAVLDAPVESTPASTPASTEPTTQAESSTELVPKPSTPADKLDKRTNPDALRKTLKWLRENGGEHSERAQDIERALGENKSFKTVWPTVREAREAKAAVEAVGGAAKIAELQTYATSMREVDEMLEAGDPRVLDKIFETGEKGIVKLLPGLIERLGKSNPAEVAAAVKPHVTGFLDSEGLPDAIDDMVRAFNANKPDEAKAVLAKIIAWYKGLGAKGATEKPAEQQAWERERDETRQNTFKDGVANAFNASMTHAETVIDRELAPELKKYGIPPETAELIRGDVWRRIERERNADPLFKSALATKINENSRKIDPTTADFLKAQVDQRVKEAVRKEIGLRYGFIKKPAAGPEVKTNVTAAPAGPQNMLDSEMTMKKLGRAGAQDAILSGKGFNSAGKPLIKVGRIWKLA